MQMRMKAQEGVDLVHEKPCLCWNVTAGLDHWSASCAQHDAETRPCGSLPSLFLLHSIYRLKETGTKP